MNIEEMRRKYLEPVRINFVLIKERIMLKKYDMPAIDMQESTTLKCVNDLIDKISQLEASRLEICKNIKSLDDSIVMENPEDHIKMQKIMLLANKCTNESEVPTIQDTVMDYFKEGFDKEPAKALQTIVMMLNYFSDKMNSGQLKMSLEDSKDNKIASLLFTTEPEMIPLLDKFVEDFDNGKDIEP